MRSRCAASVCKILQRVRQADGRRLRTARFDQGFVQPSGKFRGRACAFSRGVKKSVRAKQKRDIANGMGVRCLLDGAVSWYFVFAVRVCRRRRGVFCFTAATAPRRTQARGDLCGAERGYSRDTNSVVVAAVSDPNIERMTVVSVPPAVAGLLIADFGMRICQYHLAVAGGLTLQVTTIEKTLNAD